jgi:hypothetical protein
MNCWRKWRWSDVTCLLYSFKTESSLSFYFASLTYIHASIMLFPVLSTTHDHTRRSPRGQAGRCQSWAMEKHRSHSIHLQDVIIPEVCSSSSISVTGLQALAFKYYLLIYLFSSHSCYLCAQSLLHLVNKSTRICMFFNSNSVGKCTRDYNSYLFPVVTMIPIIQ